MRNVTFFLWLLSISLLLPRNSLATHNLGGEISFEVIAPGIYVGTYKGYYNANLGANPAGVTFNLRSPGCNTGMTFPGNRQSVIYQNINGGVGISCSGNVARTVAIATYTATFALPLPHPQCSDWYLSVRECDNGMGINIAPSQNICIYVEALLTPYTGLFQKSSPEFLPPTSLVFNLNTPSSYSNQAINTNADTQLDSIVYALKPAQNDHSIPLRYTTNTSFSQPIPSSTGVFLHPRTGIMTFTPSLYAGGINADAYTIVIEAAIYRRIFGIPTKVSSSQRNLPVYVINNPANANPELINETVNGQTIPANQLIKAQSGSTITFEFNTADKNAGDSLILILPDQQFSGFPSNVTASASSLPGSRPSGSLTFNTTVSAQDQIFYFPVTVLDNACPARGVTTKVYGVRLLGSPLGIDHNFPMESGFTAFPNPFTETINFKLNAGTKAETILIYNLLGQQIDEIQLKTVGTGEQKVQWNNANKHAAGTYIAKLISKDRSIQTLKFTKVQ